LRQSDRDTKSDDIVIEREKRTKRCREKETKRESKEREGERGRQERERETE